MGGRAGSGRGGAISCVWRRQGPGWGHDWPVSSVAGRPEGHHTAHTSAGGREGAQQRHEAVRERRAELRAARPRLASAPHRPRQPPVAFGVHTHGEMRARGAGAGSAGAARRASSTGTRAARARTARSPAPSPARAPVSATRSRACHNQDLGIDRSVEAFDRVDFGQLV